MSKGQIACRALENGEVELVKEKGFAGTFKARDRLLFILGLRTGARISELLSLKWDDVLGPDGEVLQEIRFQKRNTKGEIRSRVVPLHPEAQEAIRAWRERAEELGLFAPQGPLFASRKKRRALSRQAAWAILKQAYARAGILGKGRGGTLGTHSLRKTFGTRIYRRFRDIVLAQYALGHRSVENTLRYLDVRGEEVARAILTI